MRASRGQPTKVPLGYQNRISHIARVPDKFAKPNLPHSSRCELGKFSRSLHKTELFHKFRVPTPICQLRATLPSAHSLLSRTPIPESRKCNCEKGFPPHQLKIHPLPPNFVILRCVPLKDNSPLNNSQLIQRANKNSSQRKSPHLISSHLEPLYRIAKGKNAQTLRRESRKKHLR
jgi:hypothetical protein